MAEIMGFGLSHYPGPLVPVKYWPGMLRRWVELGRIKPEVFADQARWPQAMRQEWGDDEGQTAAKEHHRRLMTGYRQIRQELDEFRPDIVLIWGDDQYENFKRDCIPAFCVGIFDSVTSRPFKGGSVPFNTEENVWGMPPDGEMEVRCHYEGARSLCQALIEQRFDPAYSRTVRHTGGLAHSFNNTILYLDYEREGFPYPIIPFHVNCYGNQLIKTAAGAVGDGANEISPPSPSAARCFEIGQATARFFANSPWRVALIASSSWSHASLTQKHGRLYPDLAADRMRFDELNSGRFTEWGKLTQHEIEDAGQHEVLNWVCLAGAMSELGHQVKQADWVESWIFNSSKCFASFTPPQAA
jgi:hypothetical protein